MWAIKRKLFIFLVLFLIILSINFIVYKIYFESIPTCFDNKENGLEEGVDCGGGCEQVCSISSLEPNVIWAKSFSVSKDVFNVASLIENPNYDYEIFGSFLIKTFDENGDLVISIEQDVLLRAGEKRILYVPGIISRATTIKNTFVSLKKIYSVTNSYIKKKNITILSKTLSKVGGQTLLLLNLKNEDIHPNKNLDITAVIFDSDNNVVDVGRTSIDYIGKRNKAQARMIWQKHFKKEDLRIEVFFRNFDL